MVRGAAAGARRRGRCVAGRVVAMVGVVQVEPSPVGQRAELVRPGGAVRGEACVGGEAGRGPVDGGPVGETGAAGTEERVVGRSVVGGEGQALAEGAADGGPMVWVIYAARPNW